ncbi:hypothetical protein BH10PLA2_BH10PLA2_21760 [soil metagenome]
MQALLVATVLGIAAGSDPIQLSPRDLFNSFEARRVVLEKHDSRLTLDPRVWKYDVERQGVVTTDPIELGPREGSIAADAQINAVKIELAAKVPAGSSISMETRSGSNRFSEQQWSKWQKVAGLQCKVDPLAGRYLQVRLTLRAKSEEAVPAITGLKLQPTISNSKPWKGTLTLTNWDRPAFVRGSIPFHYERPDNPALARFRKAARLDNVVAGATDDFDKLVRLMDWVGSGSNKRGFAWAEGTSEPYPWDIDRLLEIQPDSKLVVKGHCMSYAIALVSAATALGYPARHWAIEGFRDMDHEVAEIWVPNLKKWVYFDPSLTTYYFDEKTKVPLSVLELHQIVARRFLQPGEDMNWWHQEHSVATRARVRQVGGKTGVGCRLGQWNYGKPMSADYDWGWNHGYLACGFIQLTPRNDFHSNPKAASKVFGAAKRLTADAYPFWVDDQTPPYQDEHGCATNWYTRARDFYWTPDTGAVEFWKLSEGVVRVELGNTMSFFREYRISIDDGPAKSTATPLTWKLHAGRNRLHVVPVDEFGKTGAANTVVLEYQAELD